MARSMGRGCRTIIAQLTQANAALVPSSGTLEARAAPAEWAADEEAEREDAGLSTRSPEQRQSWWRRVFGA